MKTFLIISSAIVLSSCGSTKEKNAGVIQSETKTTVETTAEIDTLVEVPADTSIFRGQLVLTDSTTFALVSSELESTENLEAPMVRIVDNVLEVDCYSKARQLFLKWKTKYLKTHSQDVTTEYITVEVDKPKNEALRVIKLIAWLPFIIWALLIIKQIVQFYKSNDHE